MPVEHNRQHPDVHQPFAEWSEQKILHVATAYSNPFRWATRRKLANDFRRHMLQSANVRLHFGELAYGDRPFELTDDGHEWSDVMLRTNCELFHKENIQNRVIASFPPDWEYGACIDADFHFTRHDWALEAIHQLQHYDFVQLFSSYADLSGNVYGMKDLPTRYNSGFYFNYHQNNFKVSPQFANGIVGANGVFHAMSEHYAKAMKAGPRAEGEFMRGVGATGGAYAFRRSAFNKVGGLTDRCILGHGDWYMAFGLVNIEAPDIHTQDYHQNYKDYVNAWRSRASTLQKNIGYVDGHAIHYFHGSKTRRAYSSRDVILAKHKFDPYTDIFPDYQGIYQLTPTKPDLRDDIRRYFTSRYEDDPNLYGTEKPVV